MEICLKYISGKHNKYWETYKVLRVPLSNNRVLTVPSGMQTDLSSVPKFLWGIFPPFGDFLIAALVHDYMYIINYREGELGQKEARKYADKEMLYLSNKYNPTRKLDNYFRYLAVRWFGAKIYKR